VLQCHAIQKLHGDKRLPIFLANVVNRADVGVIERRRRLRLALKPAERLGIARHIVGKKLQSDKAPQPRVLGLINDAHAAAAQLLDNAVVRNGSPDHSGQILGRRIRQVNEPQGNESLG
jgi:hypothetical protein